MLDRWQTTIVDEKGNVRPGAVVQVRSETTGALAAVYKDPEGTQPWPTGFVTADENGYVHFHAHPDYYRITSINPAIDWRYVKIGVDTEQIAEAAAEAIEAATEQADRAEQEADRAEAALSTITTIQPSTFPPSVPSRQPKILMLDPNNPGWVMSIVKSRGYGYYLIAHSNNVTTNAADSLAETGSDPTMYRLARQSHAVAVYTVVSSAGATQAVGSWATASLSSPPIPAFTSGHYINYLWAATDGATLTQNIAARNGQVRLAFVRGSTGNDAATVRVNGTAYTVNLQGVAAVAEFSFPCSTDVAAVEIENTNGASKRINYIGAWFSELKDWNGEPYDTIGWYRNSAYIDPVITNSANDYAIRDSVSGLYGGSYHGGEKNIVDTWYADGLAVTPSASPVIARSVVLESQCNIDWPSGAHLDVVKREEFADGCWTPQISFAGDIQAIEFYTTIFGVVTGFDILESPRLLDLKTVDAGTRVRLGQCTRISLLASATGQRIDIDKCTFPGNASNQYGGAFEWVVPASYHKTYDAIAHGNVVRVQDIVTRNIVWF